MIDFKMSDIPLSDAKKRLVEVLKRTGAHTALEMADRLNLTDVAIRQHLLALEERGLVQQQRTQPEGRGRPAVLWSLSDLARGLFPDRHAELTVGLIQATRQAVGEDGLSRIISVRTAQQIKAYREVIPGPTTPLGERLQALADQRTLEGYMAEVVPRGYEGYLLIEHHCPICDAAQSCMGLCEAELEVFRAVLGTDVVVERIEHLLKEDRRCVYRIALA